jgi:ribosomal protein S18 acetylase RimI-like enzyme
VVHIQRINLVCLPENYQKHCFWSHILRWPSIVRVAEARVPRSSCRSDVKAAADHVCDTPDNVKAAADHHHDAEWAVVAYVLAKMDDDDDGTQHESERRGLSMELPLGASTGGVRHVKGHITSLAVLPSHRRLGIGKRCLVCPFLLLLSCLDLLLSLSGLDQR